LLIFYKRIDCYFIYGIKLRGLLDCFNFEPGVGGGGELRLISFLWLHLTLKKVIAAHRVITFYRSSKGNDIEE